LSSETRPRRISLAKTLSVREEMRMLSQACDIATQQLSDDLLVRDVEKALEILSTTIESFGCIYLCGNGPGMTLAMDVGKKLSTTASNFERATRANILGLNVVLNTTAMGKLGVDEALSLELMANGREGDALWCFASDPGSQALLTLAETAKTKLKMPVIVFTIYPGTPIIRFGDIKIRIQRIDDTRDQEGYCVEWAHRLLADIMCNQIKRMARRMR